MLSTKINPIVSVIIPTYNRINTIERAIDSVVNQTYKNWELLIIDDGSNDCTFRLVEGHLKIDHRIKFFINRHKKGPAGARNYGIEKSSGRYIAFLDSDDEWLFDHLSESISILDKENIKVCFGLWIKNTLCNKINSYSHEREMGITISELNLSQTDDYLIINHYDSEYFFIRGFYLFKTTTAVFEKCILQTCGTFDETLICAEDVDLFFRILRDFDIIIFKKFHAICYEGNDNLYFFKNASNIQDKNIVKKFNFHRKYEIQCLLKRKNMIMNNNAFKFKHLAMRSIYMYIYQTYNFLSNINSPVNKNRSAFYKILSRYYLWKSKQHSDKGNSFFYLSYRNRFSERIKYSDLLRKRYLAFLNFITGSKTTKTYWLYIEDYVFDVMKKNTILLYNKASESTLIVKKVRDSNLTESLFYNYILVKDTDLIKGEWYNLIKKIYHFNMGGLVSTILSPRHVPFSMNRNNTITQNENLADVIREYSPELTIYLNATCGNSCHICNIASRQSTYCFASHTSGQLSIDKIKRVIIEMNEIKALKVNICGGNWLRYSNLRELNDFIIINSIPTEYYIHYLNIATINEIPVLDVKPFYIHIMVHFPIDKARLTKLASEIGKEKRNCKLTFLIESDEQMKKVNEICWNLEECNWDMIPFYNGNNKELFKRKVFLSEQDILSSINIENANLKRNLNTLNVGKLYIMSQGNVHTNMNEKEIGNINENTLMEILNNTKIRDTSWKWLRTEVEPCKDCIYNVICPPITNYEVVMNSNKVCEF